MKSLQRWFENRREARSVSRHRSRKIRPGLESLESRVVLYSVTGNAWMNPAVVTISFMPDGTNLGGTPSNLNSTFNNNPGLNGRWQNQILQAAQVWAQQTNLNFVVVPDDGAPSGAGVDQEGDPEFGDIRIGGYNFGNSNLAGAYQPPSVNNYSIAGDIFFNTGQTFNIGNTYDLFTVACHKFGHALGMDHSSVGSSVIMYPTYTGKKTGLQPDDIAGIESIYSAGKPRSKDVYNATNNSFTAAADLNSQINPTTLTGLVPNLDITTTSQAEFFTFNAPANTTGTMKVTVQSTGLSQLSPKMTVFSSTQAVLGSANGSGQYGTTLTVTASVTANTQYYVEVQGADSTAFSTGRYCLGLSFNGSARPTEASPVVAYANGTPLQSGGGTPQQAANNDGFMDAIPTITGISPDNGASSNDGVTNATRISISGIAPNKTTVTVYCNGTAIGTTASTKSGWTFDYTGTSLADGTYNFTALETDKNGVVSGLSAPYQVIIDTKAPAIPVISGLTPDTGLSSTDGITNCKTPTFSGTAEPYSTVNLYYNGQPTAFGTVAASGTGAWQLTVPGGGWADNTYNVTATATDRAGNVSTASSALTVVIDTQQPAIPGIVGMTPCTASNSPTTTADRTPIFFGTAEPNGQVTVYNNASVVGTANVDGNGNWNFTYPGAGLAMGSYNITASATDRAGNVSGASPKFTITVVSPPGSAPTPSVSSASLTASSIKSTNPDGSYNIVNNPSFTGSAVVNTQVAVLEDNVVIGIAFVNAQGTWTFKSPQLSTGRHTMTFMDINQLGACGNAACPIVVNV